MALITEAGYLGGADYSSHDSFRTDRTDEGTTVVEADYDTDWGANNANDFGTALKAIHKWARGDSPITGNALFGANVLLDSPGGTLVLGDETGGPSQDFRKGSGSTSTLTFSAGVSQPATNDKRLLHDTDETWKLQDYTGAAWQNAISVDNSAQVELHKLVTMDANLTLGSASPVSTFGNGSGGPVNRFQKADASNVSWADVFSNAQRYWDCLVDTAEDWRISRYIAGTLQESDTFVIKNSSGEVQVANDLNMTNDAPRLTMGNGNSDPRRIMDKDGATDGFDEWKSDSNRRWLGWYFNSNENLEARRYNSSEVFLETSFSLDQSNGEATFSKQIQATQGMNATGADVRGGQLVADSDSGGIVSATTLTNATGGTAGNAASLGNWHVAAASGTFAGWVKIYVGTTAAWLPYWT